MKLSLRQTVIALYAAIFAGGVALSALVIHQGSIAVSATRGLVERDVRLLRTLETFKAEVAAIEPIAYENYVFRDREFSLERKRHNEDAIAHGLQALREAFPGDDKLAQIELQYPPIKSLVGQLDEALHARPDPGRALSLLRDITKLCIQINGNAEQLASAVRAGVVERGIRAEDAIARIYAWVIAFSAALLGVALVGGYFARAYLAEGAERRRLAMFPERNPSPVFRLDADGSVHYANPGALDMLRRLGIEAEGPQALFPADLPQRLTALKASGAGQENRQYEAHGRTLDCRVHYLDDYDVFHAYLSDITERKRAEERLFFLAYHDDLTGLPNRRRFFDDLAASAGSAEAGAVVLLSLDRFRRITESLGPALGEQVLVAAAQRLGELQVPGDGSAERCELFSFEGDLFAMLVRGEAALSTVSRLVERVIAATEAPLQVEGRDLFVTFSIGVACFPQDGTEADTLVRNAESALQKALREGSNGIQYYSQELNARALDRLELEHELRQALARNELELHYQLQVDAEGRAIGVEALSRWHNQQRGPVSPANFIPLAEETGLIVPIGEWVIRTACAQARQWQADGWPDMTMAINISPRQFRDKDLPDLIRSVIAETGLAPDRIELEVTESAAMQDVDTSIAMMRELKAIGVQLSIDDFGTGYSSLAYLKRFPLDKLKVDQSFVRNMTDDGNDVAIVQAVIALGHSLGLRVIAEGVETEAQAALLKNYDCEEMQGYLFSKPLPAQDVPPLLAARSALGQAKSA
ncbi:MAG: diguanylate cyclase [Betaproteobacteria bacterium HGW-Betaproteobacteria-14]|nr:MAG: diguanylate cyclase [Betaproteobacteria bacterium HGW-Betaproteobacteria-14]